MSVIRTIPAVMVALAAMSAALPAHAQSRTFYLDRAQLSGAPDDGFMVWRPSLYPETRFYADLALGYAQAPLRADAVARSSVADDIEDPVQGQFITYVMAGAQVWNWFALGIAFPVALYQWGGADPAVEDVSFGLDYAHSAIHDLRFDARAVLLENQKRSAHFGLGAAIWTATGNGASFTSDGKTTGMLYASGDVDTGSLQMAIMAGPHFKPYLSIGGQNGALYISSELRAGAGAYVPLRDRTVRLGLEVWGTTGLTDDALGKSTLLRKRNTSIEWLAQARLLMGESKRWYTNFGAGTRLTEGYGAPDFRVLASLGYWWQFKDEKPLSPAHYEIVPDRADYEKDTDGDGYPDSADKCPTVREDGKKPEPTDGCPAGADRDHDGIPDVEDACPDDPEDKDGVLDQDGCPEEDPDKDGIPDAQDKCPTQPGPRSDIAEKNGCPSLTRFDEGNEIQLLEPIQFDFAKATIKKVSYPILDEVVALMKARTDVKIAVHGHTDSVGSDAANLALSKARAKSCMDYLISHGISAKRLQSEGFGESKPIDTNDTPAGRARNRRVEFKVVE